MFDTFAPLVKCNQKSKPCPGTALTVRGLRCTVGRFGGSSLGWAGALMGGCIVGPSGAKPGTGAAVATDAVRSGFQFAGRSAVGACPRKPHGQTRSPSRSTAGPLPQAGHDQQCAEHDGQTRTMAPCAR